VTAGALPRTKNWSGLRSSTPTASTAAIRMSDLTRFSSDYTPFLLLNK
jgi:hypothetical protein